MARVTYVRTNSAKQLIWKFVYNLLRVRIFKTCDQELMQNSIKFPICFPAACSIKKKLISEHYYPVSSIHSVGKKSCSSRRHKIHALSGSQHKNLTPANYSTKNNPHSEIRALPQAQSITKTLRSTSR